jgi:hypothetical protein
VPLAAEGISSLYGEASLVYNELGINIASFASNMAVEAKIAYSIVGGMIANKTFELNSVQLYHVTNMAMQASKYNNIPAIMQCLRNLGPLKGYFY